MYTPNLDLLSSHENWSRHQLDHITDNKLEGVGQAYGIAWSCGSLKQLLSIFGKSSPRIDVAAIYSVLCVETLEMIQNCQDVSFEAYLV